MGEKGENGSVGLVGRTGVPGKRVRSCIVECEANVKALITNLLGSKR